MRIRALIVACLLATNVGLATRGRADDAPDRQNTAVAKELFDQGLKLMDEGKYAEACAKFVASNQNAAKVSTLLNLGNCYEKTGQLASAWGTYNEAVALARRTSRADYEQFAQQRIAAIEPKLLHLTIKVEDAAKVDGLVVKRDGVPLAPGAWETAIPVDPGRHAIVATAPKKKPWERSVVVDEGTPSATVVVPALEDAPEEPPPPAPSASIVVAPPPLPERPKAPPREADFWTPQRTTGLAIGGAGVVSVGIGAILGVVAKSSYDDARAMCARAPDACPPAAVDQSKHAYSMATAATVLFIVGGLAIAGGSVVYFTASGAGVRGTF